MRLLLDTQIVLWAAGQPERDMQKRALALVPWLPLLDARVGRFFVRRVWRGSWFAGFASSAAGWFPAVSSQRTCQLV